MSKNASRYSRKPRKDSANKPTIKAKFSGDGGEVEIFREETQPNLPKFEPKTENQKLAMSYLRGGKSIVFLTGSAGAGKSMLAAWHAACLLKQKKVDKIYLVRPAVATGKSVGLLPGELKEKLAPYFAQTISHLSYFMGVGFTQYCLNNEVIEYKAVEYMRGNSLENCVCIFEECQNFTHDDFEMLLTRLGNGCTFVCTGDQRQHDLQGTSGLTTTLALLTKMLKETPEYLSDDELDDMDNLIGIVNFTTDDCVRNGLTKAFVKMYHNN